jgi:tetratricopeptide (TPR) repeat protein
LTDLELANSVLKDVKNQKRTSAAKTIQLLLDKNADLKEHWGAITRLAISIGEFKSAIKCSQQYLALAPSERKRIIQCAAILAECREIKPAIALVTPLLTKQATPDVLHFLGTTHSQIGNLELAKKYLIELIKVTQTSAISWLTLAAIYKFTSDDELYIQLNSLQKEFNKDQSMQSAPYWFALGKAALDVKNNQDAFSYFSRGCDLMDNQNSYLPKQHSAVVDGIIAHQNKAYLDALPSLEAATIKPPIFITGLPRSGTTLLQQILSSHSAIGQGGELKYLSYSVAEIGQTTLNKMATNQPKENLAILNKMQADYQHLLGQQFSINLPVVDKTLNLNHHLGLISKVFPKATIIRITRNPEDNAWSCFRNFFNQGLGWSYNLEHIAEFFHHEERLAKHWQSILCERVLEISYEDLINKPEATLKRCLTHIGLDYEEQMQHFYQKNALVQTASVGQVRKAINPDSINSNLLVQEQLTPFSHHRKSLANA